MTEVKELSLNKKVNQTKVIAEPGKQEIIITREFDAPRELVFKAYVNPDLLVQWLGPRGYTMILETFEPKSGGRWRFIHKDKEGNEFAFHGVFHEVFPPIRMSRTFEYEGLPETGHVSLETAIFEELPNDRTRVTNKAVHLSVADRDGMVQSGMEQGVNEGFERLGELLATSLLSYKPLHYNIQINAPKEKVWNTMLESETYKEWSSEFTPGSYYIGSWDKGAKIKFLSPNGEGMTSEIAENKKYEFISIRHLGFIKNGIEHTESPEIKAGMPAYENYTFSEKNGITEVKADMVVPIEYEKMFEEVWPKALTKLKQISEKN
jgi:uncharacterized protein YndB with AHSA1/START domain